MKKNYSFFLIILFLFSSNKVNAQKIDTVIERRFNRIINLIRQDKIQELSTLIDYPLQRKNPIPDIESPETFISYYPTLFDKDFKLKISTFSVSDIFNKGDDYSIFNGDIWISSEGNIIRINYQSKAERDLASRLTKEESSSLSPDLKQWKENKYKCETDKYLFRLDETEMGYRFSLWNKPKSWTDKPDLIMTDSKEEFFGENQEISFTNGDLKYVVENVVVGPKDADFGIFLTIFMNDSQLYKGKCKCLK